MAVAALVLGIVSVVFAFIPGFYWIGLITGVIGIILGALAKKQALLTVWLQPVWYAQ